MPIRGRRRALEALILRALITHGSAVMYVLAFVPGIPATAGAAGVVGNGTPASCTDADLDIALAGGGLVTFDCGGEETIDISTGTGTKTIAADTTIDGGSLVTISGGHSVGVFSVNSGVKFTVQDLIIVNGTGAGGGGIANQGTLTVTNSTFSGNEVQCVRQGQFCFGGSGGAIASDGTLTVTNSTFSGNSASAPGGGGAIYNGGTLTVTNSTFSGNSSPDGHGGGIYNEGTLTVANSTFSGNSAGESGGGDGGGMSIVGGSTVTVSNSTFFSNSGSAIANAGTLTITNSTFYDNGSAYGGGISNGGFGTLTVTNSTFAGNGAPTGGAIYNLQGTLSVTNCTFAGNSGDGSIHSTAYCGQNGTAPCPATLTNTIIAFNTLAGGNCIGTITDGGHNLDSDGTCGVGPITDPKLDPAGLADNGGPTRTIALQAGSPAVNAGDGAVCTEPPVNGLDQRGYLRPGVGHAHCSIGAYEADAVAFCIGDCDGDGEVSTDELVRGVYIALGNATLADECQAFACHPGQGVTVDCLVMAVNNSVKGCGGS